MAFPSLFVGFPGHECRGDVGQGVQEKCVLFRAVPIYAFYVVVNIPFLLLFSLGRLQEGANNHLLVARKR
jgi:hypothetical protein